MGDGEGGDGGAVWNQAVSYQLIFRGVARREFRDAAEYYEAREPGVGVRFTNEVNAEVNSIIHNPRRYPLWRGNLRRAVLALFPYVLHFRVEGEKVILLSVYHTKRNPTGVEHRR